MKPMDFEEFLWAKGIDEDVIKYFGVINLCHNLSSISDPLEGNKEDNVFKGISKNSPSAVF